MNEQIPVVGFLEADGVRIDVRVAGKMQTRVPACGASWPVAVVDGARVIIADRDRATDAAWAGASKPCLLETDDGRWIIGRALNGLAVADMDGRLLDQAVPVRSAMLVRGIVY